jgi:hypothetical protein
MEHSNYSAAVKIGNITLYEPLLDPFGPYYFFPPHCYARTNRYASPYIAYVYQGNQIEKDILD